MRTNECDEMIEMRYRKNIEGLHHRLNTFFLTSLDET
jgi:hypothetical protein